MITAGQRCPPPPQQRCPDGTMIAAGLQCPRPAARCPDGSVVAAGQRCPPAPPSQQQCPDGTTIAVGQECPAPSVRCPDGTVIAAGERCPPTSPPQLQCPDGAAVAAGQECQPPPRRCADGSTVPVGQQCPPPPPRCPDSADPRCDPPPPLWWQQWANWLLGLTPLLLVGMATGVGAAVVDHFRPGPPPADLEFDASTDRPALPVMTSTGSRPKGPAISLGIETVRGAARMVAAPAPSKEDKHG